MNDNDKEIMKTDTSKITINQRIKIERLLLIPIMEAIGKKAKYFPDKYNIPSYELVGVVLGEIERLQRMVRNQRKVILDLRDKLEEKNQLSLFLYRNLKEVNNARNEVDTQSGHNR